MGPNPDDKRRVEDYLREQEGNQPQDGEQSDLQPRGQPSQSGQPSQQRREQPPQGSGAQGQPPQGSGAQGQPPQGGGPPGGGPPDDGGVTRRQLLVGGAGVVTVAAGAGWWAFLRGPSGAGAVAEDYVNAVGNNNWAVAGALYHEDSEVGRSDESYEDILEDRGQLEVFEAISPSVEEHHTVIHVTDVDAAAEADDFAMPGDIEPEHIDELKNIRVFASVETENLEQFDEEDLEFLGDTTTIDFSLMVVLDTGDWSIAQTFGAPGLL